MTETQATVTCLRVNLGPEWYKEAIEPAFVDDESAIAWLTGSQNGRTPLELLNGTKQEKASVVNTLKSFGTFNYNF